MLFCNVPQVLEEVLQCVSDPLGCGGCGDSGRLSKDEKRALKSYVAQLQLFKDKAVVARVLEWVEANVLGKALPG